MNTKSNIVLDGKNYPLKRLSPSKRKARDRDARIKATYYSLPEGAWSIRQLAKLFNVSRMTAWYAINGRDHKK